MGWTTFIFSCPDRGTLTGVERFGLAIAAGQAEYATALEIAVYAFGQSGDLLASAYGVSTGSADNKAALDNTIAAAESITFGNAHRVRLPQGTFTLSGLSDITGQIDIGGAGVGATVLKLKSGQNAPLMSINPTGSCNTGDEYATIRIHDLTITSVDGSSGGQASADGLKVALNDNSCSFKVLINNVTIKQMPANGFNGSGTQGWVHADNLQTLGNGVRGITLNTVNDWQIKNGQSALNKNDGILTSGTSSMLFDNFNTYTNDGAGLNSFQDRGGRYVNGEINDNGKDGAALGDQFDPSWVFGHNLWGQNSRLNCDANTTPIYYDLNVTYNTSILTKITLIGNKWGATFNEGAPCDSTHQAALANIENQSPQMFVEEIGDEFSTPITGGTINFYPEGIFQPGATDGNLQRFNYYGPQQLTEHLDTIGNPEFQVWSYGTSITIKNTVVYAADLWSGTADSTSNATISQVSAPLNGFQYGAKVQRTAADAHTTDVCLVQIVPANKAIVYQGQNMFLNFEAKAGANFSAASSALHVFVYTGTVADEGTASFIAGTWTGTTNVFHPNTSTPATVTLTTSMKRFFLNAQGLDTATKEIGVKFCWTPVGTAGSDDSFTITGVDLQTGNAPTQYRHPNLQHVFNDTGSQHECSYDLGVAPGANTTNGSSNLIIAEMAAATADNFGQQVYFKYPKRIVPSSVDVFSTDGTANKARDGYTPANSANNVNTFQVGGQGFGWYVLFAPTAGVANFRVWLAIQWCAHAEL